MTCVVIKHLVAPRGGGRSANACIRHWATRSTASDEVKRCGKLDELREPGITFGCVNLHIIH